MTYTLTLCFGMFLAMCGQLKEYDYPSLEACEAARKTVSPKSIGGGYSICAPKKVQDAKTNTK